MAPPVYSLRIFGHAGLTSSAGKVGPIVPADLIYVVREIDVFENLVTNNASMFVINGNLGALWNATRGTTGLPGTWHLSTRQVYGPGEQVGVQVITGEWAIAISGYQLSLP